MSDPNFIILYVDHLDKSISFYSDLLGKAPVEASHNFAMFALRSGVMLGLWTRHAVDPVPVTNGGGCELAFAVADKERVEALFSDWCERHRGIAQSLSQMDFGYTFIGLDPDGHRLRFFCPSDQ